MRYTHLRAEDSANKLGQLLQTPRQHGELFGFVEDVYCFHLLPPEYLSMIFPFFTVVFLALLRLAILPYAYVF